MQNFLHSDPKIPKKENNRSLSCCSHRHLPPCLFQYFTPTASTRKIPFVSLHRHPTSLQYYQLLSESELHPPFSKKIKSYDYSRDSNLVFMTQPNQHAPPYPSTTSTRNEKKCARELRFPFSTLRGENIANSTFD